MTAFDPALVGHGSKVSPASWEARRAGRVAPACRLGDWGYSPSPSPYHSTASVDDHGSVPPNRPARPWRVRVAPGLRRRPAHRRRGTRTPRVTADHHRVPAGRMPPVL